MDKIDIDYLITDIEDAVMDNGIGLVVESVAPEEVEDNVKIFDTFKMLHQNIGLINEKSCWIQLAYGYTLAYVGVLQRDDKIEALVDVNEECPVDDLDQIIAEGIRRYADREGVEDVKIRRNNK